jgi:hypothetical protein
LDENRARPHRDPAIRELFALEAAAHLLDMMAESMKQGRRPGRRSEMAAPTSYSETSFKQYLLYAIGAVATSLGWTFSTNQVAEALNETLLCYGEDDIAAITGAANLLKLRTLGRREIWRAVCAAR